jgi:hypothetical protein
MVDPVTEDRTPVIDDFFLPAYVETALDRAGKLIFEHAPAFDGLTLRHLAVDAEALHIIGRALRRRREVVLGARPSLDQEAVRARFAGVKAVVRRLECPGSPLREDTLEIVSRISGFSRPMVLLLLQSLVSLVTGDDLVAEGGLPPNAAAFGMARTAHGYARYYSARPGLSVSRVLGWLGWREAPITPLPLTGLPRLVSNIAAGNVPGISIMQALLGVMVGAASLEKNASAEPYFGPRFFRALAAWERDKGGFPLSDLVALVTFPGADRSLLKALIHEGDHLQATGGLDSERDILRMVNRLRPRGWRDLKRRVSGHWHKVSFDVVAREFLEPAWLDTVAYNVAFDNTMFNTQGCLSAQQVFVEGTPAAALRFAERYKAHMRTLLAQIPKGAAPQARLRKMYHWHERRPDTSLLTTLHEMAQYPFAVVYDDAPTEFAVYNALNRAIVIRRVDDLASALPRLLGRGERRGLLQSCGAAIPEARLLPLAALLGRAGVNRVVAAGAIWDLRLGLESWDGYLSPLDLVAPQRGYWTTVSFHDPEAEVRRIHERDRALAARAAASG